MNHPRPLTGLKRLSGKALPGRAPCALKRAVVKIPGVTKPSREPEASGRSALVRQGREAHREVLDDLQVDGRARIG